MDKFDEMYEGSWYTILGCGGDIQEWIDGYQDLLNNNGIGTIQKWHEFTGAEMNEKYGLIGNNRYNDDLQCIAFSLDGLDVGKLAIFKIQYGDRWFDDIVDNNAQNNGVE